MSVKVAVCSAQQLFTGGTIITDDGTPVLGQLTIPEYQRPYRWQQHQLEALISDLRAHQNKGSNLPYYLGSLILHQSDGLLNIIDGQQRITTLALMGLLDDKFINLSLSYESQLSQQQIKSNLVWLQKTHDKWKELVDFSGLDFTLVITQSEDDAYKFFETQNTGGVRLAGPDIIKAHHLRVVPSNHQDTFAMQWEGLGKLDKVVLALLKSRYWQNVHFRDLPSHRQPRQLRDTIDWELAKQTGHGDDIGYGRTQRIIGLAGEISYQAAQQGYDARQPLNAGINSIRYLAYFKSLYSKYWLAPQLLHLKEYEEFIVWLKGLKGCGYLQSLYEACLLVYISQFGENQLEIAAKKLFRVVYSKRVSNEKAVRENTVSAFAKAYPVLDWLALSFTPEQCFSYLDSFKLEVDPSNLDKDSVKKRFLDQANAHFKLDLEEADYAAAFADALTKKVASGGAL